MRKILITMISAFVLTCMVSTAHAWPWDYTKTKYPIVLVPGVMGWDTILGFEDYFYGIEFALERSSWGQKTHLIALVAWQETEARGIDLKNKIENLCAQYGYEKVNLIAHSHGATTSRVAMSMIPDKIASLTTIAGPHYGTPFAEAATDMPDWLVQLATMGIDITGDLTALLSGHTEFIGQQDTNAVLNDFTQDGISQFNSRFPCAGVPSGGSYNTGMYGADADTYHGAYAGDGLGNELSTSDPNAIRYYSWTGNIGSKAVTNILDLGDAVMLVTNAFNKMAGYYGDADAFIPVSSSHFGQVINDNYYWNHLDETNQLMGLLGPLAPLPTVVFRQHANRLKNAGL